MPELPEVEMVRRSLSTFLPAGPVINCSVAYPSLIAHPKGCASCFIEGLVGKEIVSVERRGKYLVFPFKGSGGLVIHLGMTGKVLKKSKKAPPSSYAHVVLEFTDRALHYEDVRRFGRLYVYDKDPYRFPPLAALGPEPLSPDFHADGLYEAVRSRKAPIKTLLLNQHIVAGFGNIYVDETLFTAGIRPGKSGRRITRPQAARIVSAGKAILEDAIRLGGSSIRDYRDADGLSGEFQDAHKVYGRGGRPCVDCGKTLSKKTIGGRTSVYCPHCQKS